MPKTVKVLSVIEVRSLANIEGFHAVGGAPGLYLRVRKQANGELSRIWFYRRQGGQRGKAGNMKVSLGAYDLVSLAQARVQARKVSILETSPREQKN